MTDFKNLNLNEKILSALEQKGYTNPTPIQLQAIPHILEGKDLLGIAQTGTGKTAAFSLPILDNLSKSEAIARGGSIRCLILTPTRELATQIADNIELYGKELALKYAVIFGGVSEKPQIQALARGVDIVIGTPGRLLDLMNQGYIRCLRLEIFVLDEADRMLDMGFINDIKKIISRIPEKRQTLFFSATMPNSIATFANSILKNPVRIEVTPQSSTVEKITQKVLFVAKSNKAALLKKIIKEDGIKNVLVFSQTKHGANRVVENLETHGIKVAAIHGNKSQGAREKALSAFRDGTIQVLVATDIAARGIDVPNISHVVNYDIPRDPESYVHRIGRTGRAGCEGIAISFCDNSEYEFLAAIEKNIKRKIAIDETHPFHGVAGATTTGENHDRRARSFAPKRNEGRSNNDRNRRNWSDEKNSDRPSRSYKNDGAERSEYKPRERREDGEKKSFFGGVKKSFFGFGDKREIRSNDKRDGLRTKNPNFISDDRRNDSKNSEDRKPKKWGDERRTPRDADGRNFTRPEKFSSDDRRASRSYEGKERRFPRAERRTEGEDRFSRDDRRSGRVMDEREGKFAQDTNTFRSDYKTRGKSGDSQKKSFFEGVKKSIFGGFAGKKDGRSQNRSSGARPAKSGFSSGARRGSPKKF